MPNNITKPNEIPSIPYRQDIDHRRYVVGDEPMLFHCHHYNTFLQRSIQDASYIETTPFLIGAAAEVSYPQMKTLFKEGGISDISARKKLAENIYKWAGFGLINLESISENGGTMKTSSSHYATAWKAKFSKSNEPICHFVSGWLAGATAAIYNLPIDSFIVKETECQASGSNGNCNFQLSRGVPNWKVFKAVGTGNLTDHKPKPVPANNVDYEGIFNAVSGMDLTGNDEGLIPVFGVYLTRMYANYYNRISYEFENAIMDKFGKEGQEVFHPLLKEAGHVCAFNTFGGIMCSAEWDAMIKPSLKNKEDWVHGIIAVINTLGWGRWQVTDVNEKEATFVIHDDYEAVGHQAMFGKSKHNTSYLAEGAAAGIMDLVYLGNIHEKPELDPAFYNKLFKGEQAYKIDTLSSRAMGDEVTSFRVWKP